LVNEEDLKKALDSGKVAGAALDVFEEEPAKTHPLFGYPNVVCTPHLGASTAEAQENVAIQIAQQVGDYLIRDIVVHALNLASVSAEEAMQLGPYLKLAQQLGSFSGQLVESNTLSLSIKYEGHVSKLNTKPLTQSILQAFLSPQLSQVNLVNAMHFMKQRNISLSETKSNPSGPYQSLITIEAKTSTKDLSVSGTLHDGGNPRIISVNNALIEAVLGPHMLLIANRDRPGFIGNLGRTLGDAQINIASFHLGRVGIHQDAVVLIGVDNHIPTSLLEVIRQLPSVEWATLLHF
jgi:D-3-phosphoglycerate dehydrogenase